MPPTAENRDTDFDLINGKRNGFRFTWKVWKTVGSRGETISPFQRLSKLDLFGCVFAAQPRLRRSSITVNVNTNIYRARVLSTKREMMKELALAALLTPVSARTSAASRTKGNSLRKPLGEVSSIRSIFNFSNPRKLKSSVPKVLFYTRRGAAAAEDGGESWCEQNGSKHRTYSGTTSENWGSSCSTEDAQSSTAESCLDRNSSTAFCGTVFMLSPSFCKLKFCHLKAEVGASLITGNSVAEMKDSPLHVKSLRRNIGECDCYAARMPELSLSPASLALLGYLDDELEKKRALGDIQTMLAALWNRRRKPDLMQEPHRRPDGYRGTAMPAYILEHFGASLLRWGATAIRGDLGAEKAHVAKFIELVNALPMEQEEITQVFDLAGQRVATYVLATNPAIQLPAAEMAQQALESLLRTRSKGKVQQGLVFALLDVLYHDEMDVEVTTKAVYAGDAQSGKAGDIVLSRKGITILAYEVKAMKLDTLSYEQSVRTHGAKRDYPLVILATGFQKGSKPYKDVYLVDLEDFCISMFTEIVARSGSTAKEAIRRVLTVYNERFVGKIERDPALSVEIDF